MKIFLYWWWKFFLYVWWNFFCKRKRIFFCIVVWIYFGSNFIFFMCLWLNICMCKKGSVFDIRIELLMFVWWDDWWWDVSFDFYLCMKVLFCIVVWNFFCGLYCVCRMFCVLWFVFVYVLWVCFGVCTYSGVFCRASRIAGVYFGVYFGVPNWGTFWGVPKLRVLERPEWAIY